MDFVDRNIYYQRNQMPEQTNQMKKINKDIKKMMLEMNMSVSMDESMRVSKFPKRQKNDKKQEKEVNCIFLCCLIFYSQVFGMFLMAFLHV